MCVPCYFSSGAMFRNHSEVRGRKKDNIFHLFFSMPDPFLSSCSVLSCPVVHRVSSYIYIYIYIYAVYYAYFVPRKIYAPSQRARPQVPSRSHGVPLVYCRVVRFSAPLVLTLRGSPFLCVTLQQVVRHVNVDDTGGFGHEIYRLYI